MTHSPLVASLGSINADLVLRLPGPPTGTMLGEDCDLLPGGKASNVAVCVRRLGIGARLVGRVGDDRHAAVALAGPRRAGVDVTDVEVVPGPTGFAVVLVEPGGAKTIVRVPGVNVARGGGLDAAAVLQRAPRPDVLVADGEICHGVLTDAIGAARRAGIRVVLDPAPPEAIDEALLEAAEVVTPDHLEAGALTGVDTDSDDGALAAADALREHGARWAIVKLADGGCALSGSDRRALLRAPRVEAVDTNGAGDALAGAVGWALATGAAELDAAVAGVAASACAVQGRTAQAPLPDERALRRMMARVQVELR